MRKVIFAAAFAAVLPLGIYSQTVTSDSYTKARKVLDGATAAYGGLDKLRSVRNFSVTLNGDRVHRNQSRRPGMSERTPYRYEFVMDLTGNRMFQTTKGGFPGGFSYDSGFIVDKTDGGTFDSIRKTWTARSNIPSSMIRSRLRVLPQFVLLNMVERASRLRYLGRAEHDKRPHHIISYSNEDGQEVAVFFDERTRLLSKLETLGSDVFSGDAVTEVTFSGYRDVGGHKVPATRVTRIAGETIEEVKYDDIAFDSSLRDDKFKAPADFRTTTARPPEPFVKYTENVYTVNAGGYNVLAIGFRDYVFVMEAPNGDTTSRQAIEQIRKLFPGKPIRYVAVTHHHDDHAGGIRTYFAEGSTLLALPGEKAFFEKVATNVFTIDPDSLALNPQPIKVETIANGRRALTDGSTTVELLDIGPGPHTQEMLVAYFPNEKLIFQGDLLNRPPNGDPPIANATSAHFLNWIDSKKLAVEKIIPVHGTVTTMDEARKAVADMQAAKN